MSQSAFGRILEGLGNYTARGRVVAKGGSCAVSDGAQGGEGGA